MCIIAEQKYPKIGIEQQLLLNKCKVGEQFFTTTGQLNNHLSLKCPVSIKSHSLLIILLPKSIKKSEGRGSYISAFNGCLTFLLKAPRILVTVYLVNFQVHPISSNFMCSSPNVKRNFAYLWIWNLFQVRNLICCT